MALDTPFTIGQGIQTPFNSDQVAPAPVAPSTSAQSTPLDVLVASQYQKGVSPINIVADLMETKTAGPAVREALDKGASPTDIVNKWGGKPLADFKASDPTEQVKNQSFLQNLGQGAKEGIKDIGTGVSQLGNELMTSNQAENPQYSPELQAATDAQQKTDTQQGFNEQKARLADPHYQALMHTVGGQMGNIGVKAAPYIAAGALTGGAGVVPSMAAQGLAGAVSGATEPTIAPDQRLKNIGIDAALGAGVQGATSTLGAGLSAGKGLLAKTLNGPATSGAAANLTAAGLTPTLATTSPLVKALSNVLPGSKDAVTQFGKSDIIKAALKSFNVDATELTPDVLKRAETNNWAQTNQLVKAVPTIPLTNQTSQALTDVMSRYHADVPAPDLDNNVLNYGQDFFQRAQDGTLSGEQALKMSRLVRDRANADGVDPFTKQAYKGLQQVFQDAITEQSPSVGPSLAASNAGHVKLLILQDAAAKVNDGTYQPTAVQFAKSVNKFTNAKGEGQYTDLAAAANQAYNAPLGTTARWATPLAAAGAKLIPLLMAGHGAAEHGLLGAGIEGAGAAVGESALGKALGALANKPVKAAATGARQANVNSNQRLKAALLNAVAQPATKQLLTN